MFNFTKNVVDRSYTKPVIVEFSAPGCGPCKWMEQQLIEIVREQNGAVEFVSLPTKDYPESISEYQLTSNPTTLLFFNGVVIARLKGALPKIVVEQWIEDHIKNP